ncbi:aspartyl/asparaginyl beta-hydroxylase domain-containing protein [Sphingomonas psychrotolerans]|uniref:Aspartyl/asparaginyl beta-hydroxylase domain-containing protein n=1 Tax=Sphingomonas psychrotolerans TaxID=1327635 RepID=A0ABU3N280_9SPHN|nr:aspartyl/asparaginyl beta-hydroxylase domain-containing protein [Sphingomonas psychrotolerans]MDT8758659.1 aspartyl/asparaginyl beta-hydroxylase domain-containing protein [Sphingomonas psychrotolerans]
MNHEGEAAFRTNPGGGPALAGSAAAVDEVSWLRLAESRSAANDPAGTEAALDQLLEIAPRSVRGHILKADCCARAGDDYAACLLYRKALQLGAETRLSETEAAELQRADAALTRLQAGAHAAREARLTERGLPAQSWSPRFRQALELAAGRRKLYLQEPTAFNYPGLPHVQFFDPAGFDWVPALEAAVPAIREELLAILATGTDAFRAYIQNDSGTGPLGGNKALLHNKDWSVLSLCENGWLAPDIVQRCPRTWDAVLRVPLPRIAGWGPTVVFSLLKAGAHIAPHTGMFNTRLICHLPLIVPAGCRFRVGNEIRAWEEGKLMIFDDTIEHEAWNDGPDDRVVLIFDIWRPELGEQERHELTALFSD